MDTVGMPDTVNVWIVMSQQALDEYREVRRLKRDYDGPMDAETYDTLRRMADTDTVQAMFKKVPVGDKEYTLFSLYLPKKAGVKARLDHIAEQWPNHFIVIGAWNMDGTQVEVNGGIAYPVHPQAWRMMPDEYELDENGEVISTIAASSNADMRDINLLQGQMPRVFV